MREGHILNTDCSGHSREETEEVPGVGPAGGRAAGRQGGAQEGQDQEEAEHL